jgi:broad specificity phosphatase PhoE
MKLYFARHGSTDANQDSIINETNGEIDEHLNQKGISQANDLAEQLKKIQFDIIISSPLKRAYETAEIVNKYHGLPIKVDESFRERGIGEYTSLEVWNDLFDFNKSFNLERSEDLKEFFKRIYNAIDSLKREYSEKTILVVSHGGVHLALYAYANNLPLEGNLRISPMRNCEFRIYEL